MKWSSYEMEKDFVLRAGIKYILLFLLRFSCFLNDFFLC